MLAFMDELAEALPPVADTPDEMRIVAAVELLAVPVGVKACCDLVDLILVRCDDGIVARRRDVLGLPVERLDKGYRIGDDHGLFVGHVELGIAVHHMDARIRKTFARVAVLLLAVTPLRIQHDADLNATMMGVGDCLEKRGVGEKKHLDADGFCGSSNSIENG